MMFSFNKKSYSIFSCKSINFVLNTFSLQSFFIQIIYNH